MNSIPDSPDAIDAAWRSHRIHAAYSVLACCQIVTFPEDISEPQRQFTEAFLARAEAAVSDLDSLAALREQGLGACAAEPRAP